MGKGLAGWIEAGLRDERRPETHERSGDPGSRHDAGPKQRRRRARDSSSRRVAAWGHISPYGAFVLDMDQRPDLDVLTAAWGRVTVYIKRLLSGVCYSASRASKGLRRGRWSRPRGEMSRVGRPAPSRPPTGTSAPRITCRQPRWLGCSMLPRPAGTGCATTFCY